MTRRMENDCRKSAETKHQGNPSNLQGESFGTLTGCLGCQILGGRHRRPIHVPSSCNSAQRRFRKPTEAKPMEPLSPATGFLEGKPTRGDGRLVRGGGKRLTSRVGKKTA